MKKIEKTQKAKPTFKDAHIARMFAEKMHKITENHHLQPPWNVQLYIKQSRSGCLNLLHNQRDTTVDQTPVDLVQS